MRPRNVPNHGKLHGSFEVVGVTKWKSVPPGGNAALVTDAPFAPSRSLVIWISPSRPTTQVALSCQLYPAWTPPSQPSTLGLAVVVGPALPGNIAAKLELFHGPKL